MKWIFLLALVVLLVACKSPESAAIPGRVVDSMDLDVPVGEPLVSAPAVASTGKSAWFAYADASGSLLVWGGPDTLPPGPYFLVTADGEPTPLKDMGRQIASSQWNGRHVAGEFHRVGGHRFEVADQEVKSDRTYLVVTQEFLSNHTPVFVYPEACMEMDSIDASLIPHPNGRKARKAWKLAFFASRSASAVQFEGQPPLAALVVADGDSAISERYVGKVSEDSSSIWRVDDEGVFEGCAIAIIAAFTTKEGLVIARTWAGPEGESDALLQESADSFAVVGDAYRYWSPE